MTNAELFKKTFGIYAGEFWSYTSERMQEWINTDVPDTNVGDTISRQAAIDALGDEPEVWSGKDEYAQGLNNQWHYDVNALKAVPSAQPESFEWCHDCKEYDTEAHCCHRWTKVIRNTVEELKFAQPEQRWIPVKTRPMDEEERAYWSDLLGYDVEYEDAVMFDCKMPDDGQEILVSFGKWVNMDKCDIDGGLYGLEGNGDWDGVDAWMPLPKPWKGESDGRI